ncbi:MAG TPA: FAD-dependent oxidoreductase [Phycisphaerales bacterium]|nr:FAD-dependent oxidoreductase [Phycisphaerales bacterium]
MKIAIVGSGISGLTCAYLLAPSHEVTLFEKDERLGGHTHTVSVAHEGRSLSVDTGFIVFNERNYPNFCRLLDRLGVGSRPTTMSFSVRDDADGFEYGGNSIAGVVGPAANLLRRRWWSVVRGVARLGETGRAALRELPEDATIADLCSSGRFSREFLDGYLVPMGAAIWSAPRSELERFPARFLLRFFDNHGMLNLRERPRWRTVEGGSRRYIEAMLGVIGRCVRTGCPVEAVLRRPDGVLVRTPGTEERFDEVVIATHSDQALATLADATPAEREVLSTMPYQMNDVVLHTDARLLPRRRRCWAAWNVLSTGDPGRPPVVTYNMTILQGLDTREPLCVTLNATERIAPSRIIRRFSYAHPLYTLEGERARSRWAQISGVDRTHFCGAYWGNGFHEDGVNSALRVCERLGVRL